MAGVGGIVGMGSALGYGFKLLVDVVSKQLTTQNEEIKVLRQESTAQRVEISEKLDRHIADCKECKSYQKEVMESVGSAKG